MAMQDREQKRDKRARPAPMEKSPREREIDAALRIAAGAERFQRRDPIYQLSEHFAQTFDLAGRQAAQEGSPGGAAAERGTDMRTQLSLGESNDFIKKFSQTAFQNGTLASAILLGQGKTVLLSCFKRSAGMAGPTVTESMRKIDEGANQRYIKQSPSEYLFNDDEAYGAVALVVKATRRAGKVLSDLRKAALDAEKQGTKTLRKVYPFLFAGEEKRLLEQLHQRRLEMLKNGEGKSEEYRAVCRGIDRCEAQIQKKKQMANELLNKLDRMRANALTAEALFQEPAFLREASAILLEEAEAEQPPEGEGNEPEPGV